jgi:hypothetical protein
MRSGRKIPLQEFDDLTRAYGDRGELDPETCEVPGCEVEATHRAPKSPDRLNDYYWFCVNHVQAYNKSWNYYAGMSEDEVEAHIRKDTTWQRPTWRFGERGETGDGYARPRDRVEDPYDVLDDEGPTHEYGRSRRERAGGPPVSREEHIALGALDLDGPVNVATLKARYKSLVKRYHPDANGGSKEAEERLKVINHAYTTLKKLYSD